MGLCSAGLVRTGFASDRNVKGFRRGGGVGNILAYADNCRTGGWSGLQGCEHPGAWRVSGPSRPCFPLLSHLSIGSRGVPSHGGGTDTCTSGLCLARSQIRGMGLCDLTSGKPGEGYLGDVPYTETDQSSKEHPLLIVLV